MGGFVKCALLLSAAAAASAFNLGSTDVIFHLYTRANPQVSQPLLASLASILTSSFSIGRNTIVTIHSSGETVAGNFNAFVVPAHLAAQDVNILSVDWSNGAEMYTEGLGNAPQAGRIIASFINILWNQFGYSPTNVRIVGHGLGGHVAGIAARHIDVHLPHIIAIDPSLVGWTGHPEILSADAADVVEVLHTTAGLIGYDYPLGDLDFYANGGSAQQGCGDDATCSHIYAYAYYAESITRDAIGGNRFTGVGCGTYENAIVLLCTGNTDVHFGGTEVKTGVSGIYAFLTNMVPPFARG